jgi:CBS domain-containing protein
VDKRSQGRKEHSMAQTIGEIMTREPVTFDTTASVLDAAIAMRDQDIGDVLVTENGRIRGIVTDRDIVMRVVSTGQDPAAVSLAEIFSPQVKTLSPSDDLQSAVSAMREGAIRRIAVVDGDRPVGVVSLGDLAVELDRESALGEISAAPPNN